MNDLNWGKYSFVFNGVKDHQGPNYVSRLGTFDVWKGEDKIGVLQPEKRTYMVQQSPMTEAAIDPGLSRDLYVALGEPLDSEDAWAVRIYLKPYIRWIWFGCLLMGLGGGLAATDKRYRRRKQAMASDIVGQAA